MKIKRHTTRIRCAAALSCALLVGLVSAGHAANLSYTVTINTLSLVNNSDEPFSLDLQLETGSGNPVTGAGNVSNTVTLSDFVFTGGTASGTPNFTQGGESGSLASTLTLTNTSGNNEFAEAFSSTVTQVSFEVTETLNTEVVSNGTPTPDEFNVFIDDNNTADGYVPTTDPTGNDTVASSSLVSGDTASSVNHYALEAVPEPGSTAMLCIGSGAMLMIWFRRKGKAMPTHA
jgi:hypothetical protein